MRFGCCVALASFVPPTSGARQLDAGSAHQAQVEKVPDAIQVLVDAGCDFMEFGVGMVAPDLPEASFETFRAALADAPLAAECFNSFIAPSVRLVGPERDWAQVEAYVSTAVARVAAVGGEIIVFGSGAARNVPDGYSRNAADAEIEEFLRFAGDQGRERGVTIAIEPLNTKESNILTSVAEACVVAARVDMPEVTVLADFYHMDEEDEPLTNIVDAGGRLSHVHVADTGRLHPGTGSYDYPAFWQALAGAGYDSRISVECNWRDFPTEVAPAMRFLRESFPG
ncbi:TIM barrel protein [Candidatus Poribacteria bacterium]|jgi:sugar phosphate isomerase/epimerase|nr:TIM barrel protein [Candidatus Poribacteria bacterium]MBT5536601.1 TIM barrel protein [Candidatus Poribacteria bacterium]MBT5713144.1 TIM barrel protein [Candidatus Poribacteria bacterium]MBT7099065.1 TIM barrel protein [Candidatus Poribacteria bacterium]MBT7805680.1 TIM barrel protein [Candidatus Poribacteria bacterium]